MFEFTIRSTKNIKEFSVKFDDGEIVHSRDSSKDSPEPIEMEQKSKNISNSPKRVNKQTNKQTNKHTNKHEELLDISDLDSTKPNNDRIIQKPEVPDVVVNVDPNLHNLNL